MTQLLSPRTRQHPPFGLEQQVSRMNTDFDVVAMGALEPTDERVSPTDYLLGADPWQGGVAVEPLVLVLSANAAIDGHEYHPGRGAAGPGGRFWPVLGSRTPKNHRLANVRPKRPKRCLKPEENRVSFSPVRELDLSYPCSYNSFSARSRLACSRRSVTAPAGPKGPWIPQAVSGQITIERSRPSTYNSTLNATACRRDVPEFYDPWMPISPRRLPH